ncbi:type II secretion system protein [bacterium]|nr:type II secretion system protein [bacterium]
MEKFGTKSFCNNKFTTHDFQFTRSLLSPSLSPAGQREKNAGFTLAKGPRRTGWDKCNSLAPCGRGIGRGGKKVAFTLAEVLITLGIIGVVAAMTIPTLIANTQGQRVRSQFKKTLSTLNQAGKMAQAQYDWDFGAIESGCSATDNPETSKTMCALLNGTLKGANYAGTSGRSPLNYNAIIYSGFGAWGGLADLYLIYQLSDGGIFGFQKEGVRYCTLNTSYISYNIVSRNGSQDLVGLKQCIGFIDVNGTSKPNKEVTCSDGTAALDPQNPCVVSNKNIGDVIPVVFHDGVVEPATNAGKYLLNTAK